MAAALTAPASEFKPFSRLPGELRNQIWLEALPKIGPTLHPYQKGGWRVDTPIRNSPLQPADASNTKLVVEYQLNPDLQVRVGTSVSLVSREARAVARGWADRHDFSVTPARLWIELGMENIAEFYTRPFDRARDALFLNSCDWYHFFSTRPVAKVRNMPDPPAGGVRDCSLSLPNIAVPLAVIHKLERHLRQWNQDGGSVARMISHEGHGRNKLILLDDAQDPFFYWCELRDVGGGLLVWDRATRAVIFQKSQDGGAEITVDDQLLYNFHPKLVEMVEGIARGGSTENFFEMRLAKALWD